MTERARKPSYWDYIRVEELLALQSGIERDEAQLGDDEVRFIVIHQIDELWFKLALRELTTARDLFARDPVPESSLANACRALQRVSTIFRLAASHFELMETMRTHDYLGFRDKLSPASGFQSAQMRELEILLGLDNAERIGFGNESSFLDALRGPGGAESPALRRVQRRLADTPTLKHAVYAWLARAPIDGSTPRDANDTAVVERFTNAFLAAHRTAIENLIATAISDQAVTPADVERLTARYRAELGAAQRHLEAADVADTGERARVRRLRAAILFVDSHRELPLLAWPAELIDRLVEAEQSMLVFRQRHARMVERVIGRRVGTGGSDGVDYLDQTALRYRVFKEIWAARTLLLRADRTPPVGDRSYYGFTSG